MSKPLKPGQFATIKNVLYRAKKQENGCEGCALASVFLCPNVKFRQKDDNNWPKLDCYTHDVILIKVE